MPKPWFKMWHSTLDNFKFQSLSGDQVFTWINLMCVALKHDCDGELPSATSCAFQMRIPVDKFEKLIEEQVSLGMVDKFRSHYKIHDWEHWQGDGMSDAERKQRQRDKDRDMSRDKAVTGPVTDSEPVTCLAGAKTETKTETKKREEAAAPASPACDPFLPLWVPKERFYEWMQMRKRIKKPVHLTQVAAVVRKLDRFRSQGYDPEEILDHGIAGSNQGLFPPDYGRRATNGHTDASRTPEPQLTPEQLADAEKNMNDIPRILAESRAKRLKGEAQ